MYARKKPNRSGSTSVVVVADSGLAKKGLMNRENIAELEKNGYKYIVGARIKSENRAVTDWILSSGKGRRSILRISKDSAMQADFGLFRTEGKERCFKFFFAEPTCKAVGKKGVFGYGMI
jgi:hypothetical protein